MYHTSTSETATMLWSRHMVALPIVDHVKEGSGEDAYLMRLGASIRLIRKRFLRLSQDGLGQRVGRDKNTISRWENGRTALSAFDLVQLWRALDVPCDWVLDPTDSISDLEARVSQLLRVASEAARAEMAGAPDQPSGGAAAPRRGRPPA